ncbi:MAG: SDR family oxidoreductase [Myxococcaceae bacterium]
MNVLITGANTGIGAATAKLLAAQGHSIVFACRNEAKTKPVMDAIAKDVPNAKLEFLPLDLNDLQSVAHSARRWRESGKPLDVLLLNAGLVHVRGTTAQGYEPTFGVNHLGHFLLTLELEPSLRAAGKARVVVVASRAHERKRTPLDEATFVGPTRTATGWAEYEASKLANVLFVKELARRWKGTGITSYALHPGVIASDLWRALPWPFQPMVKLVMKTPEEGSVASVRCATAPELANESGRYYGDDGQPRPCNPLADDEAAARRLWDLSLELTAPFRSTP